MIKLENPYMLEALRADSFGVFLQPGDIVRYFNIYSDNGRKYQKTGVVLSASKAEHSEKVYVLWS